MLINLLSNRKPAILDRWYQWVHQTYPAEAATFMAAGKDRFQNPVGFTLTHDLRKFFEALLEGKERSTTAALLDYFIQIRAVQDLTPSQAVSFIFLLKRAIRENLAEEIEEGRICRELLDFESRLDEAALQAFESYMKNREKIFEIKARQIRFGPFKTRSRAPGSKVQVKQEEDLHDDEA
jgi:hypothetical protein